MPYKQGWETLEDNFDLIDFGDTLSNIGKAKKILEFDKMG